MVGILVGGSLGLIALLALVAWLLSGPERCPMCRARAVRIWERPTGPQAPYFCRCERCGLRLKDRYPDPWEDASAPEYDVHYEDAPPLLEGAGSYRRARSARLRSSAELPRSPRILAAIRLKWRSLAG